VINVSSPDIEQDFTTLRTELFRFKPEVAERQRVLVLNKTDLVNARDLARKEKLLLKKGEEVIPVSAVDGTGIEELKERIREIGQQIGRG